MLNKKTEAALEKFLEAYKEQIKSDNQSPISVKHHVNVYKHLFESLEKEVTYIIDNDGVMGGHERNLHNEIIALHLAKIMTYALRMGMEDENMDMVTAIKTQLNNLSPGS